jgi:prepilin-type N-terminal cleavage/methylation domain-containing protein
MRTPIHSAPKPQIPANSAAGFTLIEILVTLAILGVMASVMIGYSAESGRQTFLLLTRESIVQLYNKTKSDALAAYSPNNSGPSNPSGLITCGYGLHVDRGSGTMTIFESESADCDTRSDYRFSSSTGDVLLSGSLNSYVIDTSKLNLTNDSAGNLDDVVFTSPNVQTYVYTYTDAETDNSAVATQGGISLDLVGNTSEKLEVDINNAGQISWQ